MEIPGALDVWNYHTHCLPFKQESDDMLWNYPLMRDKEHLNQSDLIQVNQANIDTHHTHTQRERERERERATKDTVTDTHRQYYNNANPNNANQEAVRITVNAQALSKELFRPVAHMMYMTLVETIAANAAATWNDSL